MRVELVIRCFHKVPRPRAPTTHSHARARARTPRAGYHRRSHGQAGTRPERRTRAGTATHAARLRSREWGEGRRAGPASCCCIKWL